MFAPTLYYVCFLLLVAQLLLTLYVAFDRSPDLREPFDFDTECATSARLIYDIDWLWCEESTGWPVAHIVNPLDMALFIGNPLAAFFVPFFWEAIEADMLSYLGRFLVFANDDSQLESGSGSLIADAQIQGGLGVLLAWLIAYYTEWPGILTLVYDFDWSGRLSFNRLKRSAFVRITLLWFFNTLLYALPILRTDDNPPIDFGVSLGTFILAFYALFVMRPLVRSTDAKNFNLRRRFDSLLRVWVPVRFVLMIFGGGWPTLRYLHNHYEECWLVYFLITIVILAALWRKRRLRRPPLRGQCPPLINGV